MPSPCATFTSAPPASRARTVTSSPLIAASATGASAAGACAATSQARLFGGTENYLVTREFREIATAEQRLELLDCLFAVAAADGSISAIEESQAGQIAKELGFTQPQYASALAAHAEHRTVLKSIRAKREES